MAPEEENIHDSELDWTPQHELCGPRRRRWFCGGVAFLGMIIVIGITVSSSKNNAGSAVPSPSTGDSRPVGDDEKFTGNPDLLKLLESSLASEGISTDQLSLEDGYQYEAFMWLSQDSHLEKYDEKRKLQRFALACLYYATYSIETEYTPEPSPWKNEDLWLSDESECKWTGIQCVESTSEVHTIALEDNNLSGKLPMELSFLKQHITDLDFTNNGLYMEGDDLKVFQHLTNLKTLTLDHNFLVSTDGLPKSLAKCTNMHRLRLSYNLLGGPLDTGVLENMQKLSKYNCVHCVKSIPVAFEIRAYNFLLILNSYLTHVFLEHLEIESNFFTGSVHFLANMTSLTYVYLRRNSLTAHLSFVKEGTLTNLATLWLDNNPIAKSIPTEIGLLTNLDDFSVTNADLTGSIPTEFGHLKKLKKIWLFNNKLVGTVPTQLSKLTGLEVLALHDNALSGTMPSAVCDIIENSAFPQKALSTDCNSLKCDCCTECA